MDPKSQPQTSPTGWSWGGFFYEGFVIFVAKKYWWLLLYLLFFVPILNILLMIGFKIYFGRKSRALVVQSSLFANQSEAMGFMKGLDHVGKITLYIVVPVTILAFVFSLIFSTYLSAQQKSRQLQQQNIQNQQQYNASPTQ